MQADLEQNSGWISNEQTMILEPVWMDIELLWRKICPKLIFTLFQIHLLDTHGGSNFISEVA